MIFKYYLGLGSNIEPKIKYLQKAIHKLDSIGNVIQKSGIYESLPWGKTEQDVFLNAVIRFESDLSPFQLLAEIKRIEKKIGRTNINVKWGPREIDIDLLFSDNISINKSFLNIPHKYFMHRNFVLQPMKELNNKYSPENNNLNIEYYFQNSSDKSNVKLAIKNW